MGLVCATRCQNKVLSKKELRVAKPLIGFSLISELPEIIVVREGEVEGESEQVIFIQLSKISNYVCDVKLRLVPRGRKINKQKRICLIFQGEKLVEVELSTDNSEEIVEETDMPLQIHISNVRPKPGKTCVLLSSLHSFSKVSVRFYLPPKGCENDGTYLPPTYEIRREVMFSLASVC